MYCRLEYKEGSKYTHNSDILTTPFVYIKPRIAASLDFRIEIFTDILSRNKSYETSIHG
jgi:hypothetical protein